MEFADAIRKRNPIRTAWGILVTKLQDEAKVEAEEQKAESKIEAEIKTRPKFWKDYWAEEDQVEIDRNRHSMAFNDLFAKNRDMLPDSPEEEPAKEYSKDAEPVLDEIMLFVDDMQNRKLCDNKRVRIQALVKTDMIEKAGIVTPLAFKVGVLCSFFKPAWKDDAAKQRASLLSWCAVTTVATFSIYMEAFHEFCLNPTSGYRRQLENYCDDRSDALSVAALRRIAMVILDCGVVMEYVMKKDNDVVTKKVMEKDDVFVMQKAPMRPSLTRLTYQPDVLNTKCTLIKVVKQIGPSPVVWARVLPYDASEKAVKKAKKTRGLNKVEQARTDKIMLQFHGFPTTPMNSDEELTDDDEKASQEEPLRPQDDPEFMREWNFDPAMRDLGIGIFSDADKTHPSSEEEDTTSSLEDGTESSVEWKSDEYDSDHPLAAGKRKAEQISEDPLASGKRREAALSMLFLSSS
jgi:hypothetical protein